MEVSIENVKEISVVTSYVMMGYDPNAYTDLLRVSSGWISYKRVNFHTKKIICEWSYKTTSYDYFMKWDELVNSFYHELNCPSDKAIVTDCGTFNIRVSFKDNTHVDIPGTSDFYSNNLSNQAIALFNMVPRGEQCPDFIKPFIANFYEEELIKSELEELDLKTVNSIMYAEGGAMGWPGLVEITTDENVRYSNREKSDISQIEALNIFNDLELFRCSEIRTIPFYMNDQAWFYIGLGAGNHLYLRDDLYFKVADQIITYDASKRYMNWRKIFHDGD